MKTKRKIRRIFYPKVGCKSLPLKMYDKWIGARGLLKLVI